MFSKRVLTFLVLLFTFGMFALASPVDTTGLVARDASVAATEASLVARTGDSGQALLDVLVKLKVDVDAVVALFDGINVGPILDLIAIVNAAVAVCANIDVAVVVKADVLAAILDLVVKILGAIVVGLSKYNVLLILTVLVKVDVCLSAFVSVVVKILPGFLGVFTKDLINVDLFLKLKLVLTLTALGLGSLI